LNSAGFAEHFTVSEGDGISRGFDEAAGIADEVAEFGLPVEEAEAGFGQAPAMLGLRVTEW
jgi:hypothetical protein